MRPHPKILTGLSFGAMTDRRRRFAVRLDVAGNSSCPERTAFVLGLCAPLIFLRIARSFVGKFAVLIMFVDGRFALLLLLDVHFGFALR